MFIPNKCDNYGTRLVVIFDVNAFYLIKIIQYTGKVDPGGEKQVGEYFVKEGHT